MARWGARWVKKGPLKKKPALPTGILDSIKVIYTKYSKHWPYTVAHTIDCVCRKC